MARTRAVEIDIADCWNLLKEHQHGIGRLAFQDPDADPHASPEILPVNFVVLVNDLIIRTGQGTIQRAAARGVRATFELDRVKASSIGGPGSGWSVLAKGDLTAVQDETMRTFPKLGCLEPSAGGFKPNFVQLSVDQVSGRHIRPTPLGLAEPISSRR